MNYEFLQQYCWFLVNLVEAIFLFIAFTQGAAMLLPTIAHNDDERGLVISAMHRVYIVSYALLGILFALMCGAFPLFCMTTLTDGFALWGLALTAIVAQGALSKCAVREGTLPVRVLMVISGYIAPLAVGVAISTLFYGANFAASDSDGTLSWTTAWHGLDAFANPWNVVLGVSMVFLSQTLGLLYAMASVENESIRTRASVRLWWAALPFVVLFAVWIFHLLFVNGWAVKEDGVIVIETCKYGRNFLEMPIVAVMFLVGVGFMLAGVVINLFTRLVSGVWFTGIGVVLVMLGLFQIAGYNNTAYYPSTVDMQSSLTIANSCSSVFVLAIVSMASFVLPLIFGCIVWAWRSFDKSMEND